MQKANAEMAGRQRIGHGECFERRPQVKRALVSVLATATLGGMSMGQTNVPPSSASVPPAKTWADKITLKGDLRYRYESINDDSKHDAAGETYTRQRDRLRARLRAEAKCNENLKAGVEVSTGQGDPISGNQTLGDGFAKKDFRLSLAYLDYSLLGDSPHELHGIAGKMKNPFLTMPDDLVWDPDLSPEGVAAQGRWIRGIATLLANGGYMWVQERTDKDDLMLYAGQSAVQLQFLPEVGLTVGASYYGYQNVRGADVVDWESKNNAYGNSTVNGTISGNVTNKAWANDFTPVVLFAQFDVWILGKPVSLYVQELHNGEADDENRGHLYGLSIGKARNPKTWEVGYSYTRLEKDATLGMFTDSDRWGGGTDGKGHKIYGKYQIMQNLQAAVTYFRDKRKIADPDKTTDYDRLQVDLTASF